MTTYCLELRNTQDWSDCRYRKYTTSKRLAEAFRKIPRIDFTDSGHGIVSHVQEHSGARLPRISILSDHVAKHLDLGRPVPPHGSGGALPSEQEQAAFERDIEAVWAEPGTNGLAPPHYDIASAIAAEVMGNDHLCHLLDEQQQEEVHGFVQEAALKHLAALSSPALPGVGGVRPSFEELTATALVAVRELDDWANINETDYTGWGDGDVPPQATFWRVKTGQALKALEELHPPKAKP